MTPPIRAAFLVMAILTGSRVPVEAQSLQKLSVQGSGSVLFATEKDPDFVSRTRLGYEGQIRYTFSRVSVGVGYQRSTVFAFPNNSLRLDLSLGFIEPRMVLTARSGVGLYAAGRVGLGKLVCGGGCESNKTDVTFGGGVGLLFRVTRRVAADLGGQLFRVSGSLSQDFVMARAGLSVGL
jgi:opacity protein-like surface antigen